MANRIVQAVYDLVDNISGKLTNISDALFGHKRDSDTVTAGIEKNNKRISQSYADSAQGIGKLQAALAAVAAFVGLEKIKDGLEDIVKEGERFDDLQKQFNTAFGGLEQGSKALESVRDLAKGVPQSFEDVSAAAIKLRQLGFDPLDGTLQSLLDNQNALNQSQEGLMATIDALGKANVRGGVNLKSLVSITETGIPVFDLLGKAMGVSSDRVRELANSGQLTSDSIKLLITQLGKLRAGASASELGDTDSQLTKLKDTAKEFLEEIAQSGALQVFRDNLKQLNTAVEEAAQSGRLKQIAQSISDGIVATAGAIKVAITFVFDYAGALTRLAQVYVTFKGVEIASAILKTSAALQASAIASRTAAAEAATATGIFGKLGASIGAIKNNIILTVAAVGIENTIEQFTKLIDLRQQQVAFDRQQRESDADNAALKEKLAAAIDDVKTKTQQFAAVGLESAAQLKQQTADQLKGYADQLAGAKTFYNALKVEALGAKDAVALEGANVKIAEIDKELAAVNAQLAVTKTAGTDAAKSLSDGASKLVTTISELGADSKAISDLFQKTFAEFDLKRQVTEVGDFALALDTVAAKGGKAADILDATLLESLKKLSGEDLLAFQSSAVAAMNAVGAAGEKNSNVLKVTLEAALDRLGVKAEATGQTITKTGTDIIATFTAVAENAQASSKTIEAAFDAALINAKTVDEAKALGSALQAAAAQGKIGLQDMAAASRDLDERLRTLTASVSPLASQFQLLGIKTQAQLNAIRDNAKEAFDAVVDGAQRGTAAQEDVVRAFKAYADTARAAAADSSQSNKDQVEEQLAVLASVLNLTDALGKAGDAGKKAGNDTRDSFGNATDAIDQAADAADAFGNKVVGAAKNAAGIGTAAQKSAQQTQQAFGGVVAVSADAERAFAFMNDTLLRTGTLANVSLDDAKFLLENLGGLAGAQTQVLVNRINELEQAAEQAKAVADKMAGEASSLQDEIDQIEGNTVAIEDRRHAQKLADLKAEAEADGTFNTKAYRDLIALEDKLHDLKLANIKSEAAAQNQNSNATSNAKPSAGGTAANEPITSAAGGAAPSLAPALHFDFTNAVFIGDGSQASKTAIAEQIARMVKPQLDAISIRSR